MEIKEDGWKWEDEWRWMMDDDVGKMKEIREREREREKERDKATTKTDKVNLTRVPNWLIDWFIDWLEWMTGQIDWLIEVKFLGSLVSWMNNKRIPERQAERDKQRDQFTVSSQYPLYSFILVLSYSHLNVLLLLWSSLILSTTTTL